MVMGHEVVHQHPNEDFVSSSFLIIPTTGEHGTDVTEDRIEITTMYSNSHDESWPNANGAPALRDTSDSSRHFDVNNTRDSAPCRHSMTVNTHDSILDLESLGGDDDVSFSDEYENMLGIIDISSSSNTNSIIFDDVPKKELGVDKTMLRSVSPTMSANNEEKYITKSTSKNKLVVEKETNDSPSVMGNLTLYSVTDSFVDSICTSTTCALSENFDSYTKGTQKKTKSALAKMDDKINEFQESCHSAIFNGCEEGQPSARTEGEQQASSSKAVVSTDIWQLLGCSSLPGESELQEIWSLRTTTEMLLHGQRAGNAQDSKQPVRASIRKRMKRIHRLRMDDRRVRGASRHGVTITNHCLDSSHHSLNAIRNRIHMKKNKTMCKSSSATTFGEPQQLQEPMSILPSYSIEKSYSMVDDPLAQFIGKGEVEPIAILADDGYDSDPEVNCYSTSSSMVTISPTRSQSEKNEEDSCSLSISAHSNTPQHHDVLRVAPIPTDEIEMRESVQQTLNSTWTLTWHPNSDNRKDYNIPHSKPICINMWLERGAVMTNSGVVVEPAFMWRDAYQPLLLSRNKLNNSTQKPWSMRLLNACRISLSNSSMDRSKYPLARSNSSFLLKSCGGEEFLLEAKCPEDAVAITQRWKLVVARFACLAVTEDVGGIAREFFHPTSDSRMLTVPDPNNVF